MVTQQDPGMDWLPYVLLLCFGELNKRTTAQPNQSYRLASNVFRI